MPTVHILQIYKDYPPVVGGIEHHLRDLAEGLARCGDQVTVLVMQNSAKQDGLFTVEERCRLIRRCLHAENIQIDTYDGLLVDYAKQTGAAAVVKGLRALSGFELVLYLISRAEISLIETSSTSPVLNTRVSCAANLFVQIRTSSIPKWFRIT